MADAILAARGLVKHYGSGADRVEALAGVDVALAPHSVLGVVGESGSGKSTLARILVGLEAADAGEVLIGGRPVALRRPRSERRRVQMVFQDPRGSLNPRMSVLAAVEDFAAVHRLGDRRERRRRAVEALELVGVPESVARRRPSELSGGQLQRACVARALVTEPEVLVADEPTSSLDVSIQGQVLNLLDELRERLAIVLITHDIGVVRFLADDVVVMRNGQIAEAGRVDDVVSNPADPYTRRLLAAAEL